MLDSTGSTNTFASALAGSGEGSHGTVVATGFQTSGRGQGGNRWESERGMNLTFSIIVTPENLPAADQFLLSMVVSLGIAGALKKHLDGISIKWPNDIYAGDDKIAGILIEHAITGNVIGHTIAGIGLNVNQTVFTGGAPNPVSMKLITGTEYNTAEIMNEVLESIDTQYRLLFTQHRDDVTARYNLMLYRRGEWHRFRAEGREFRGMITGTGDSGALLVKEETGTTCSYLFREIGYII